VASRGPQPLPELCPWVELHPGGRGCGRGGAQPRPPRARVQGSSPWLAELARSLTSSGAAEVGDGSDRWAPSVSKGEEASGVLDHLTGRAHMSALISVLVYVCFFGWRGLEKLNCCVAIGSCILFPPQISCYLLMVILEANPYGR
jgi:hypothetical protein